MNKNKIVCQTIVEETDALINAETDVEAEFVTSSTLDIATYECQINGECVVDDLSVLTTTNESTIPSEVSVATLNGEATRFVGDNVKFECTFSLGSEANGSISQLSFTEIINFIQWVL